MASTPTVLLDCDGVIVDNREFEQRVTSIVIENLAGKARISRGEAAALWKKELQATKGSPRWYDYTYHCNRLGLNGDALVMAAHEDARDSIRSVPGASETLALFDQLGLAVSIVTDATRWVVDFKLKALEIDPPFSIFASSDAGATKATANYWKKLVELQPGLRPMMFVDNRQVNLISAHGLFPKVSLVRFAMDEHVTTLSRSVAPRSESAANTTVITVTNHRQLRSWFRNYLPELV